MYDTVSYSLCEDTGWRSAARGEAWAGIAARRRRSNWRPRAPPLSRPLPPELQGGEENFDRAPEGASHLPPPRSLWGRAGGGGAHHLVLQLPETPNLPISLRRRRISRSPSRIRRVGARCRATAGAGEVVVDGAGG